MTDATARFATVEEAVEDIRQGRMIVLVDDEDRENEGDLTMAAEKISPEAINFMAKYARGLICLPLTEDRCDELNLPLMSPVNTSVHGTAFCEAIDGRIGVTTGISASDRAITILTATDNKTRPQDLARPGRADRGERGPRANRRAESFCGDLRDHERRRQHVPGPAASRILQTAQFEDAHGS
jgi:3,4-dihydroxy-2-butanone 4-phosphate synthase